MSTYRGEGRWDSLGPEVREEEIVAVGEIEEERSRRDRGEGEIEEVEEEEER